MRIETESGEHAAIFPDREEFYMARDSISFTLEWYNNRTRAQMMNEDDFPIIDDINRDLETLRDTFDMVEDCLPPEDSPGALATSQEIYLECTAFAGLLDLCMLVASSHDPRYSWT